MHDFTNQISDLFSLLLDSTLQVSVLVCCIFILKALLNKRLAVRWHYWLWLLLLVRMALPITPESNFSVFTLVNKAIISISNAGHYIFDAEKESDRAKNGHAIPIRGINPQNDFTTSTSFSGKQANELKSIKAVPETEIAATQIKKISLMEILSLTWLGIAALLTAFALTCNLRLWRVIKSRRPVTDGKILDLLEDCKAAMGVNTIMGIIVTDKVQSPALFGVIRPRLLLPAGLLESVSNEHLRYIFLHELAHLKRNDIYLGWIMVVFQILHWFNPMVWLAFGKMRADRELACDGLVLSKIDHNSSAEYGKTLLHIFKNFSGQKYAPGIAGILEDKSQLKRRIKMISSFKNGSYKLSILAVILLAVFGAAALTNAAVSDKDEEKSPVTIAEEVVQLLVDEDFDTLFRKFDDQMKEAVPLNTLKMTWKNAAAQAGAFRRQLGVRTAKLFSTDIVTVTCEFENGPLDVQVACSEKKQISGLLLQPVPSEVLAKLLKEQGQKKATPQASIGSIPLKDSLETGFNAPEGWEQGKDVPGVRYIWDKHSASDGKASLCLIKTERKYFPIAQWTKKLTHTTDSEAVTVSAQVRAKNLSKGILDVLFLDKENQWIKHEWVSYIGEDKDNRIPPVSHNWKKYSGTIEIPPKTASIVIGLQIYGPGAVWFDEIEVSYAKKPEKPAGSDKQSKPGKTAALTDSKKASTKTSSIKKQNTAEKTLRFKRVLTDEATVKKLDNDTRDYYKSAERFFAGIYPIDVRHKWESQRKDEKTINNWIKLASGNYSDERNAAIAALGVAKIRKSASILQKIVNGGHRSNRPRWIAARSLGKICDPESVPSLIDALDHFNKEVRIYSNFALVKMTAMNYEYDKDAWIRWWARNKDRLTKTVTSK